MKRKLTKEEEVKTLKGLERVKTELIDLNQSLEFNKDILKQQEDKRKHDDKWKDYLRSKKDEADAKIILTMEEDIKFKTDNIEEMLSQLNEGAEVK